jgi:2-hydroxychromene-2-carboxylate isomerase
MLVLRMATLDFWYEFASTYSYLSVMRIEQEAERAGVALTWRPFLLGPIFKAQGWDTSPFNIYPAKGRYMARDVARLCAARGLPFRMPEPFPQNGLYAARLALIGAAEGWAAGFTRAVFAAEFAEGAQIAERDVLARCLVAAGQNAEKQLIRIEDQGIKNLLKAQTTQAEALGIFGAPTFVTEDGELFWGDDRLEQALEWATRK